MDCILDDSWDLDHGAWITLNLLFPEIKYSVIEISLLKPEIENE